MKYWAFLSYSHTDKKWGDWLHKALETYRVPRRLVGKETRDGKVPEHVYPIFRDREELPVSADLGSNINEALKESRYLVVICSPRSAQSRWVGEEIKTFKKLGREDRILALIVDGEPNTSDGKPGFKVEDECFHEAMRYRMADGEVSEIRSEPIAADAREGKDEKTNAKLKLIAGLLGVDYDDLKQREQERRLRRTRRILAAATAIIAVFVGLSVALFFKEREAALSRDEARATLSRSDFLQALRSIDEDRDLDALAQLARSLRFDPRNQTAGCRLATLLAYREYPTLLLRFKDEANVVQMATFSPDSQLALTVAIPQGSEQLHRLGSEIRIWDVQSARALGHPINEPSGIVSARFSSDSKQLLIANNHDVGIRDARTGKPIAEPVHSSESIRSAEFSPNSRQLLISSADFDGNAGDVRVCDAKTGKTIADLGRMGIGSAAFNSDGTRIVTASDDQVRLWDVRSGRCIGQLRERISGVDGAEFSADGTRIVTTTMHEARIWNAQTGEAITEDLKPEGRFVSANFSSDGAKVITSACRRDNGVCSTAVWDANTGKQIGASMAGGSGEFSSDGKWILTTSKEGARLWDAGHKIGAASWNDDAGKPVTELIDADSATLSKNGGQVLTVSRNEARVWSLETGKSLSEGMGDDEISFAEFNPSGSRILTTSNHTIKSWDCETAAPTGAAIKTDDLIESAKFSRDGKAILVLSAKATLQGNMWFKKSGSVARSWNAETGTLLSPPVGDFAFANFDSEGRRIVVGSKSQLEVIEVQTGRALTPAMKPDFAVSSARFTPTNRWILVEGDRADRIASGYEAFPYVAQVWDALTGKPLTEPIPHARLIELSPDGKKVATVERNQIKLRLTDTGKYTTSLPVAVDIDSIRFSPDGRRIVISDLYDVRIYDSETLKPLSEHIRDPSKAPLAQFSLDGVKVLTQASQIFDAATGAKLNEPVTEAVRAVEFSPDGRQILTISKGEAHIWDVAPAAKIAPEWLPRLAEAIAWRRLTNDGVLENVANSQRLLQEIRDQLDHERTDDDWTIWGQWFLAERSTRTISPFSKITVPEYIENRIKENTAESLDEAEQLAIGNAELQKRIAQARETLPKTH